MIWGYGGNTNEASDFTVEFSTDGGNSYSLATETVQTSGLVGNDHARLAFDVAHETNFVRLTITNNAKGRGFPGAGGDRVGLGEFRFVGSALQVITPTAIAQTQGDSLTGFSVAIGNLIDGSGLSDTPTTANLHTVTHNSGPTANYWATHTQGAPSYFEDSRDLPVPQFTLTLDGPYSLSALVVWGLSTGPGNEASDFTVEFSTDGGNSYSSATETLSLDNTTGGSAARLSFGQAHEADFVRFTITNNAKGRGFPGSGGDRVGLGEIRFVGSALASNAPPVALAGTLVLVVNVIAGDDTVNIEEQAAGFAISGHTGSVGGVNVTVRVGHDGVDGDVVHRRSGDLVGERAGECGVHRRLERGGDGERGEGGVHAAESADARAGGGSGGADGADVRGACVVEGGCGARGAESHRRQRHRRVRRHGAAVGVED